MFIKLKIEGELLELLQEDADESVRTCTQQAMYIIKSYYKEGIKKNNNKNSIMPDSSLNISMDTHLKKEKLFEGEIEKEYLEVSNIEIREQDGFSCDEEFIDEDILNF